MWEVQLHSDQHAWDLTQGEEVRVEEPHWNVGSCIQLHPKFSYRVQPLLSHVWETTSPSSRCSTWFGSTYHHGAKHFQICPEDKRMCRWVQRKAEAFQAKEAQRHKCNYDKKGRAAALEVGDTVLVCVTAFKGHHKIQDRWQDREYVVEKWSYPNVPDYVVCPRNGEGQSQTLHRNYLLPINSNLEQGKMDKSMVGVGNDTSPTPVPSVDNVPADAGSSRMVTTNSAGSTPQGSPDWPVPLRCDTRTTRNQLPWRYQNFGLLADTGPTGIWGAWVGLCICLHIMFCLYTIFWGSTV